MEISKEELAKTIKNFIRFAGENHIHLENYNFNEPGQFTDGEPQAVYNEEEDELINKFLNKEKGE